MEETKEIRMAAMTPGEIIAQVDQHRLMAQLEAIERFRALVKNMLKPGYDYGTIKGKPVLLKPGAEKLTILLGLQAEFDIVDKVEDFERGFFAYTVKCRLTKNGYTITEGLGHANTREKNRLEKDPYTEANAVLKMAEKRALVDAALHVGALSDVFTQDLEDMAEISSHQSQKVDKDERVITDAQRRRLFALADGDKEIIKEVITAYGYSHTKDIKRKDYEAISEAIQERAALKKNQ